MVRSSSCASGECIEAKAVAALGVVYLRTAIGGDVVSVALGEWAEFLAAAKRGDFDHLGDP